MRDCAFGHGVGDVMQMCQTKPIWPIESDGWLRDGFRWVDAGINIRISKIGWREFHETQEGGRLGCLRFHLSMRVVGGRDVGRGKGV